MSEEDMSCGCFEDLNKEEMNKEHSLDLNNNKGEGVENQEKSEDETIADIKKQINNGKTELSFEHELSEEGFDYLLDLLSPNSKTAITSLGLISK